MASPTYRLLTIVSVILLSACSPLRDKPATSTQAAPNTSTAVETEENPLTLVEADKPGTPELEADKKNKHQEKTPNIPSSNKPIRSSNSNPTSNSQAITAEPPRNSLKPEIRKEISSEIKTGTLSGVVSVIGNRKKVHRPSNVIITLEPLFPDFKVEKALHHSPNLQIINTKNKVYKPVVQTIRTGSTLRFNNQDKIKHNVFSSSGNNTFDLGTYSGGKVREVTLNSPGIVKVYCNIHPEMASFVMVSDNRFNAISDKKGLFVIEDIPEGKYRVNLWHIRGEASVELNIKAKGIADQHFVIDASSYKRSTHKNKFGQDYEKKPALFEDEFY